MQPHPPPPPAARPRSGEIALGKTAMAIRLRHAGVAASYGTACRAPLGAAAPPADVERVRAWLEREGFLPSERA